MKQLILLPLLSPSLCGPALARQDAAGLDAGSIPLRSHGVSELDGRLSGAGPDYSVRFRTGEVVFLPHLGLDAERSFPISFRFESARRGEGPARTAASAATPRCAGDDLVTYAAAPGVTERWQTRLAGVEQSYVFDGPLDGAGDLVVRGRITTDLVPTALGLSTGGVRFELPAGAGVRGAVEWGAVTGIDAEGAAAPGSMVVGEDELGYWLELALPAGFVDAATYPLVLDPLIGSNVKLDIGSFTQNSAPAVAYDASNDVYLVAWERLVSIENTELQGRLVRSDGTFASSVFAIDYAPFPVPGIYTAPTVAAVADAGRFLVAFQQSLTYFGAYDIRARSVSATDGAVSPSTAIADTEANEVEPDAAGTGDGAIVVWAERGLDVRAEEVFVPAGGDGQPVGGASVALTGFASDWRRPAISQNRGAAGNLLVAMEHFVAGRDRDLYLALLDASDGVSQSATLVASTVGPDEEHPDVDGDGDGEFLLVYQVEAFLDSGDNDVRCRRVTWDGSALSWGDEVAIDGDVGVDEIRPAVGRTDNEYLVAYSQATAPFAYDVLFAGLDPATTAIQEGPTIVESGGAMLDAEVATRLGGGLAGDSEAMLVYTRHLPGSLFLSSVHAQRLDSKDAGAFANLGGGCGGGGSIALSDLPAVGDSSFAVTLAGADPVASFAVLNLSVPAAGIPCGPCVTASPETLFTTPLAAGSASQPLPIPADPILGGAVVDVQWMAVLLTPASPCPSFSHVSASDRYRLTIGE